jgi:hypothetical protein
MHTETAIGVVVDTMEITGVAIDTIGHVLTTVGDTGLGATIACQHRGITFPRLATTIHATTIHLKDITIHTRTGTVGETLEIIPSTFICRRDLLLSFFPNPLPYFYFCFYTT